MLVGGSSTVGGSADAELAAVRPKRRRLRGEVRDLRQHGLLSHGSCKNCTRHPFRIRIYRDMMLDSTVVCRRALGCEWGGSAGPPKKTERPCVTKVSK
jgi:hypothetical protein